MELLTLLVGGSGAVLACLDAGLDTRRRDVLDGKKSSLMSPARGWHQTTERGKGRIIFDCDTEQYSRCTLKGDERLDCETRRLNLVS